MKVHAKHIISGGFLIGAVVGSNFLNFLFNALLGRWLSFESFGLITLIITFYYVSSIFTNALAGVVNFSVSKMEGNHESDRAKQFFEFLLRQSLLISIGVSILWLALTPLLMNFFHASSPWPFVAFIPILIGSIYAYAAIGYFQGRLHFGKAGTIMLTEPIVKLIAGVGITLTGAGVLAYLSLPISLILASVIAAILVSMVHSTKEVRKIDRFPFPWHFFSTSLAAGIGASVFFSLDIFLVRHFFNETLSGQYALVSLIGKMVYFFAVLPNMFTLPIIARSKDEKMSLRLFWMVIGSTIGLSVVGWVTLVFFGHFFVPLLFGQKAFAILQYLPMYVVGISLYSFASVIISFQIVRQRYVFGYLSLFTGFCFTILMAIRHETLSMVISNLVLTCLLLLSGVLLLTVFYPRSPHTHAK